MKKLNLGDVNFSNKKVLMRVDFNVPLRDGKVMDDQRIVAALPSIKHIMDGGGKLILISHLGRPKGEKVPEMSLAPVAEALSELVPKKVHFVDDCMGEKVTTAASELKEGEILLLENLRFYKEETDNDSAFAKKLAELADVFVNDAFGTAHRAHASTHGVTQFIQPSVAGFLMEKELRYLKRALDNPQRPFVAIIGGAKISGKIDVISALLPKVDKLIIGGAMIFTFFKAMGRNIGNSLLEADKVELARELLKKDADKIELPVDCMVSDQFDFASGRVGDLKAVSSSAIEDGTWGLDIGPETLIRFQSILSTSKTVVWNGPMGVFEIAATAKGTNVIAQTLADITRNGAITVIGGGDSAAAVKKAEITDKVSHVSTGGGASLEFLEGKILPGIAVLTDK